MLKIRITGLSDEVEQATEMLNENFKILSKSDEYKNRNSEYVRVYIECESKNKK